MDVLKRINQVRDYVRSFEVTEKARKWVWLIYRVQGRCFFGIDIYDDYFILWFKLPQTQFEFSGFDIRQHYKNAETKIEIHPETDLEKVKKYINETYRSML